MNDFKDLEDKAKEKIDGAVDEVVEKTGVSRTLGLFIVIAAVAGIGWVILKVLGG